MGASGKLKRNGSELPQVNGDIIFGAFIVLWSAMMVHQMIHPWEIFAFERWMYPGGDSMPSPGPDWTAANYWVPGVCTFAYFTMLLHLPKYMKNRERPKWLKKVIFFWNICLSLCSSWAALRIVGQIFVVMREASITPVYTNGVRAHPFYEIICDVEGTNTCQNTMPMPCQYLLLFTMSKIPEMMDTLWLVLGKKDVIFLHWFHHSSVMWFCWLAWTYSVPMATVFALMNLSVHAVMYVWYALAAADKWLATGLKPKKFFSQTVTVVQILQMVLGLSLALYVHMDKECGNAAVVTRYALGMYGVYLFLFVHFFYRAYCSKKKGVVKRAPVVQDLGSRVKIDKRSAGGAGKPIAKKKRLD